ncbi:MAG: hypothetical protein KDK36_07395 [Leptospiraceae bacterium]|nr:hypothetical protein [Leptospiraceae bacterium]
MKILIEIEAPGDWEKLTKSLEILQSMGIKTNSTPLVIAKGNKKINPESIFGIWKNSPHSISEIRKNAWRNF